MTTRPPLPPLPTKVYLHLSLSAHGYHNWTVFTNDHKTMKEYPQICSIDVEWPVTQESVEAQVNDLELGALYTKAGDLQHALDQVKEQIAQRLAIGHDEPELGNYKPHPEWEEVPHTANVTAGPDGRIVANLPNAGDFDQFDDDIPF